MYKDDLTRLQHIIDAADDIARFISGRKREDLDTDRMLLLSLVKCIEILGEAVSKISPEFRSKYPQIPWQEIVGMRNWLVHVYFDIDHDKVWSTVTEDIPDLLKILQEVGLDKGSV